MMRPPLILVALIYATLVRRATLSITGDTQRRGGYDEGRPTP